MSDEPWIAFDRYVADLFLPPDPALDAALEDAKAAGLPSISVSAAQGRLLHVLALALGARRILEVGTLAGYSAIWLARALPAGGRLITLEADPTHAAVARANLARAGLDAVVEVREGRAAETLPRLVADGAGPFDLIFIDADKPGYADYLGWALNLSRPGTLIVADNVVRKGQVADDASDDPNVLGARRFNASRRRAARARDRRPDGGQQGLRRVCVRGRGVKGSARNREGGRSVAVIETARLALRELTPDDAAFMVELLNDPSFLRYIGDRGVRTIEDARRYIETGPRASYARHGFGLYLVERKAGRLKPAPTGDGEAMGIRRPAQARHAARRRRRLRVPAALLAAGLRARVGVGGAGAGARGARALARAGHHVAGQRGVHRAAGEARLHVRAQGAAVGGGPRGAGVRAGFVSRETGFPRARPGSRSPWTSGRAWRIRTMYGQ